MSEDTLQENGQAYRRASPSVSDHVFKRPPTPIRRPHKKRKSVDLSSEPATDEEVAEEPSTARQIDLMDRESGEDRRNQTPGPQRNRDPTYEPSAAEHDTDSLYCSPKPRKHKRRETANRNQYSRLRVRQLDAQKEVKFVLSLLKPRDTEIVRNLIRRAFLEDNGRMRRYLRTRERDDI